MTTCVGALKPSIGLSLGVGLAQPGRGQQPDALADVGQPQDRRGQPLLRDDPGEIGRI